ncbi:MAG: trypsin-like serine protease [Lawsonibacter sp.]|nr:trypsin-like serine protease [Lawsonibacter sp.]
MYPNEHGFHFYNSENDGYRGGFGAYSDPVPTTGGPVPPPKKKRGAVRAAALILACAVAGGAAGVGGAAAYQHLNAAPAVIYQSPTPQTTSLANTNSGQPMTPEQLYAANLASCVGITVNTTVNIWGQTTTSAASGSGFVLTQDGYIVTNYHVIEDAAKDPSVTIDVSFASGDKYTAQLVGGEKDNDVAVLKIDASGLQPVTLGDSSKLAVGQTVVAIGNPLGELTYSLTGGYISALDRLITTGSGSSSTTLNMLQTDCAINPGNSGGPLFNVYGQVIGITTAKYTQSSSGVSAEGLGFAIPINDVKNIISDLIQHGYVTGKPYLGITVDVVSSEAQRYGIPAGAVVKYVAEGSCAQKAGLQTDDIIIAIDGTAIDSPSALTAALSTSYKAGSTAVLTVIRSQQQVQLTVTLDEKNEQTVAANQQNQQSQQSQQQLPYYSWPFSGFFY